MKRKMILALAVVMAVMAFVSCGQAEESNSRMFGEIPDEYKAGDTPVDFEVELLSGELVKISDLKGKVVLLNFWFISCPPCVAEMPAFEKLKGEYGDDLVILAVNSRDKKEKVTEFIEENGYTFNVGLDPAGVIKWPVGHAPYTLVIDREGVIGYVGMGAKEDVWEPMYEEYKAEVEKLV